MKNRLFFKSIIFGIALILILGANTPTAQAEDFSIIELLKTQIASIQEQITRLQGQLLTLFTIPTPSVSTTPTQSTGLSCTDTDGGTDIYTKGTLNWFNRSYEDHCASNYIVEYYCTNANLLALKVENCQYGCENGACKQLTTQPSITVISPNGGESWKKGEIVNISWNSIGLLPTDKINIWLEEDPEPSPEGYMIIVNLPGNTTSYKWAIPSNFDEVSKVKISVQAYRNNSLLTSDYSDNYFTIVSATTVCTDSDGGINIYQKGTVIWYNRFSYTDRCWGNTLIEYYCQDNRFMSKIESCQNGCYDGACKRGVISGALTVTEDASSPNSNIIIEGEIVTLGVFRLSANSVENLDLDQITVTTSGGDYIDTLYFYNGDNLLGSIAGGNEKTIYFNDSTLIVPANGHKLIAIKAKPYLVDGSVVKNDSIISVALSSIKAVKTTGTNSGAAITGMTEVGANKMYLFKSRPYFSLNSSSPSGNLYPSSLTLLAIFDVRANSGKDITFDSADGNSLEMMINYNMSDISSPGDMMSFILKDSSGNLLDNRQIVKNVGPAVSSVIFNFSINSFVIPAGTTKQIYVYGNTTDFEDYRDSIQVWLDDKYEKIDWGIDGAGSYNHGDIIFRGEIYGGPLANPS